MNLLITGSRGFIGRRFVEILHEKEIPYVKFDGDISQKVESRLYQNLTHIFHLAARTSINESWESPFEYYRTNLLGVANVFELCRANGCGLTFLSTYVYGHPMYNPIDESHRVQPTNHYTQSKILGEDMCRFYAQTHGVPVTVLRPFNVYGINQRDTFLISNLVNQALNNEQYFEIEDLHKKRDYIFVDDLVEAMLLTVENNYGFTVYNIGTGLSVSTEQLIDHLNALLGIQKGKREVAFTSNIKDRIVDIRADASKFRNEFNWRPTISVWEGTEIMLKTLMTKDVSET